MRNKQLLAEILQRTEKKKPLVYQITNFVTANDCANAILAIGASPVMGLEQSEAEDMVSISDSVVINIGTACKETESLIFDVIGFAKRKNIPIVLDPVGAGATKFRTNLTIKIIEEAKPVIRCNYSEFLTIAGVRSETNGVDSVQNNFYDLATIVSLSKTLDCIIAVTGDEDVITDGQETIIIHNGSEKMERISGTGCMCSALTGATIATAKNIYSVATAIALMGISGEKAAENFRGLSSMKMDIIDNLSLIRNEEFLNRLQFSFL